MQFVTTGNRIAVENFTVGYLYTITFTGGEYIHCACTGIGMDFVMFSRTAPEYTFALTMETAEDVSSIDLYSEGGGTMNYNDLTNKPQINGVELTGNKTSSDIGIQPLITADNKLSYTLVSGLGTAATTASTDYATAAQGALADSAVQPSDMNSALNAKQNLINSDNMLSADLVDDTSTTNKFATAAELQQIETNKTNILLSESLNPISVYSLDSKTLTGTGFIIPEDTAVKMPKGDYNISFTSNSAISGTLVVNNGSTETYRGTLSIVSGSNSFNFSVSSNSDKIRLFVSASCEITNLSIVPKSYRNSGYTDYVGATLPNTTLTPALVECVDNGAKNRLNITGVDMSWATINADKSITVNYTTSASNQFVHVGFNNLSTTEYVSTPSDFVGCMLSGNSNTTNGVILVMEYSNDGSSWANEISIHTQTDKARVLPSYPYCRLVLKFVANTPSGTYTFKPMICTAAEYKASQTYQPYAMSNVELTTLSKQNQTNILSKISEYTATTTITLAIAETYEGGTVYDGYSGNDFPSGLTGLYVAITTHKSANHSLSRVIQEFTFQNGERKSRYYNGTTWTALV